MKVYYAKKTGRTVAAILVLVSLACILVSLEYNSIKAIFVPALKTPEARFYAAVSGISSSSSEARDLAEYDVKRGGAGYVVMSDSYNVVSAVYLKREDALQSAKVLELSIEEGYAPLKTSEGREPLNAAVKKLLSITTQIVELNKKLGNGAVSAAEIAIFATKTRDNLFTLANEVALNKNPQAQRVEAALKDCAYKLDGLFDGVTPQGSRVALAGCEFAFTYYTLCRSMYA